MFIRHILRYAPIRSARWYFMKVLRKSPAFLCDVISAHRIVCQRIPVPFICIWPEIVTSGIGFRKIYSKKSKIFWRAGAGL